MIPNWMKRLFNRIRGVAPIVPIKLFIPNMDQDFQFFNHIITGSISIETNAVLMDKSIKVISDKKLIEMSQHAVERVYQMTSAQYKEVLYQYIDRDEFLKYISDIVCASIAKFAIDFNSKNNI